VAVCHCSEEKGSSTSVGEANRRVQEMVFLSSRLVSQLAKSQYAFTTCSSCTIRQSTARLFSGGSGGEGFHTPQSPPPLFDLILRSDWNAALKRVEQYPREAHYRHPRGFTMLHCAVESGAPLEVITAIVHAFPGSLMQKDWKGRRAEDVALYNETKDFLRGIDSSKVNPVTCTDASANTLACDEVVHQIEKLSKELLAIETRCSVLRTEMDVLIAKLKGTS
jgi:hypothetical protein